jgi:hypothetical protein
VDLRRALLLFAIVLGLAAIASSIARPPERDEKPVPAHDRAAPQATDVSADVTPVSAETVEISAGAHPRDVRLAQGRETTLHVSVKRRGQVEIPRLGLIDDAEPLTPARFDLLVSAPGRYPVLQRPTAASERPVRLATLVVRREADRRPDRG